MNEIRMEKTMWGTPQQNGMAECMNMTLNECARSMMLHDGTKTFWADVVNIAAYLTNKGPSIPLSQRKKSGMEKGKSFTYESFLLCFICPS
jgi:hypothetical protein